MSAARGIAWRRAALVVGAVLVADQLSKKLVVANVTPGESDGVLPGIELVRVRNHGVAFGVAGGKATLVAIAVGLALLGLLIYFARHAEQTLVWLPTGLLLGGALGNVFDRIRD